MFEKQIGIDLGTANVLVYVRGRGIVINEPSMVAISTKDGKVKAVGVEARDIGGFVGANPLSIFIPCHRVVGSNGKLTGYAGGLDRKRYLLELENAIPASPPALW